jgi:ribonucleoside-diphosphate reductase alpha chain
MSEEGFSFPNLLSEFVYTRTYARWLETEKRRESWPETVTRYIKFIFAGKNVPPDLPEKARKAIMNFDLLPSMRALWCAGGAMARDNTCGYNCFSGDEKFVTDRGNITFQEARDAGEVQVLAGDGQWRGASVHYYGKQPLFRVTLDHYTGGKHGNQTHTVRVTADHRWILQDESVTTSLKVGDKLYAPNLTVLDDVVDMDAMRHGFVYGDGTINKADSRPYAQVRLCGKKARLLGELFSEFKHSYPPSYEGDPMVYLGADKVHWKELPTSNNPAYVAGFLRGLFLADGCGTGTSGNLRFSTQQIELVEWVRKNAALAGYKFLSDQTYTGGTNYGERSAPLHLFILGTGNSATFRVESITPDGEGDVYCVVEPHTRSFTLANGQVTGNCSFLPIDNLRAFGEALYILMMGTGVGFSVERTFIDNLPEVASLTGEEVDYIIGDSTEGWADAVYFGITAFHRGQEVKFNYDKIRPKGARLKMKGGRASGPEPLKRVLDFAHDTIRNARGRHLKPIEAHDIMCMIAEIVMVGGFRRASLISFSDPDDADMRHAKDWSRGDFPTIRYMANNAAFYAEKPARDQFDREWEALVNSGSGERSFFIATDNNRGKRGGDFRCNPCGEIKLRFKRAHDPWTGEGGGGQFCNLTAAVMRSHDTLETMAEKVRIATWIGAVQSSYTYFPYLRPAWSQLCEEDRLLGVDITGQCDHPELSGDDDVMHFLNATARATAIVAAEALGIRRPAAITCGKPSGNSSQFVDCASGFHPRFAKFYHRHVRISSKDPLFQLIKDAGVPVFKENGQEDLSDHDVDVWVARFPVKSPTTAMTRQDERALDQCNRYLKVMRSWCGDKGHNQSATIYVREDEWNQVGEWLWEHFEDVTGLSFLPFDGGNYRLAPYEEITEAEYNESVSKMPTVNFDNLTYYEQMDEGHGSMEPACVGGVCEI